MHKSESCRGSKRKREIGGDEQPAKQIAIDDSVSSTLYNLFHAGGYTTDSIETNSTQTNFIETAINKAAQFLTQDVVLKIGGCNYSRLTEIEFYFTTTKTKIHPDPFTHQHKNQLECGKWYFHRSSTKDNAPYKSGTYKGLDIAIGSIGGDIVENGFAKVEKVFGGVLIRGLMSFNQTTNTFSTVDGPCKCVEHILKESGFGEGIEKLVESGLNGNLAVDENENVLCLVPKSKLPSELQTKLFPNGVYQNIYSGPRVGLTLKKKDHSNERQQFIMKPYRFHIAPTETKKGKVNMICAYFHQNKMSEDEVDGQQIDECAKLFGVKKNSVKDYLKEYSIGGELSAEKFQKQFIGVALSTSLFCQLAGYLGCD